MTEEQTTPPPTPEKPNDGRKGSQGFAWLTLWGAITHRRQLKEKRIIKNSHLRHLAGKMFEGLG